MSASEIGKTTLLLGPGQSALHARPLYDAKGISTPSRLSTPRPSAGRASPEIATAAASASARTDAASFTLSPVEHFADLLEQIVARERLREKIGGEIGIEAAGIAGNAEELQLAAAAAQVVRQLGAAHVGHAHVGQEHVDRVAVLVEDLHRLLAVARLEHGIARALQRMREQLAHGGLILHEQYRFHGGVLA